MRLFGRSVGVIASLVSVAAMVVVWPSTPGYASVALTQISADPFTNADGQHRTEVAPDIFQPGTATIFSVFQAGRSTTGGSAGVGFARALNREGTLWSAGFLNGITVHRGGGLTRASATWRWPGTSTTTGGWSPRWPPAVRAARPPSWSVPHRTAA